MFEKLQEKLGLNPTGRQGPGREDDVADDHELAQSRDTGGAGGGTGDAESTTGTGSNEEFVGRVSGQDDGAERLTGAEARAFGADERGDKAPDLPSHSDG
jgi:hypothetical protein